MQSPARVCSLAPCPSDSCNLGPSCWMMWEGSAVHVCDIAKVHGAIELWPFPSLGAPQPNFLQDLWLWRTPAAAAVSKGLQPREGLRQGDGGGTAWETWESPTVTEFSPLHVSFFSVLVFSQSPQRNFHF